jgi:ribosomal protein L11 methyltransferase
MGWLVVSFESDAPHAEAWGDALIECGAVSVDVTDAYAETDAEQAIFAEPGELSTTTWTWQKLSALFPEDTDVQGILGQVSAALDEGLPTVVTVTRTEDQDWVRATQEQFQPICISRRLWIVPTWHAIPETGAINLILDPGLAFGTGSHPTTRLCLRWLDEHLRRGQSVMDYGCGSGILAIAASKLGASSVAGVDIDPYAIIASRANAAQNQVDAEFLLATQLSGGPFDVVMANILANPLRVLAPLLCGLTGPGGHLVLSGLLSSQASELSAIYAQWVEVVDVEEEEGWARLVCRRASS